MSRRTILAVAVVALASLFAIRDSQAYDFGYNPVIGASDRYYNGSYWNPYTGSYVVRTNQDVVHASATNPHRNDVLPGSMRYVNRYERDQYGRLVHVTGWQWTSINGQPHGTLRRTVREFQGYTGYHTPNGGFVGRPVVEHQSTTTIYKSKAR